MKCGIPQIRRRTGICEKTGFLTGSFYVFKGWLPVPLPYKGEHEKMTVLELYRRITDDMEELVARAYPTHQKEWIKAYAPHQMEWLEMAADPLPEQAVEDAKKAADNLAFIVKNGATWLEYLFVRRNKLMREVAAKNDLWPVNLGIKWKKVKGRVRFELARCEFARAYLLELGVNTKCEWPSTDCTGAEQGKSPFHFAAGELYRQLLQIKKMPDYYFKRPSRWSKRLAALEVPMTKRNFPRWWPVAKVFLEEEWEINRRFFQPLINHLKIKPGYDSEVKTRVIYQSLKDAFFTLARDPNS